MEEEEDLRLVLTSSSEEDNDISDSDEDVIQISDNKDNDSHEEVLETIAVSTSQYPITGDDSRHHPAVASKTLGLVGNTLSQLSTGGKSVSADKKVIDRSVVRKCRVQLQKLDLRNIVEMKAGRSIKPGPGDKQQLQQKNIKTRPGENQKLQSRSIKPGPGKKQQLQQRCNKPGLGEKQKPQQSSNKSGKVEQRPGLRSIIKPGPGGEQSPSVVVLRTVGLTARLSGLVTDLSGRVRSGVGGCGVVRKGVNRLTRGEKRGVTEVDDRDGKVDGGPEESKDKVSKVKVDKKCEVEGLESLENKTVFVDVVSSANEYIDETNKLIKLELIDMEDQEANDPLHVMVKPCCIKLKKIKLFSQDGVIEDRENCDQASSQHVQLEVVTRGVNGLHDLPADEDALATNEEVYPQTDDEISLELEKMDSLFSVVENFDSFHHTYGISEVKTFEDEEALRQLFNSCQVLQSVPYSAIEESEVEIDDEAETEVNKAGIEIVCEGEVCNKSKTTKVDEQLNAEEVNCKALNLEQHCKEALSEDVIHESFAGTETNSEVEPLDVELGKLAEDNVELESELKEDTFMNVNEMQIPCLSSSVQSGASVYVDTVTEVLNELAGMIDQVDNVAIDTKIVDTTHEFPTELSCAENDTTSGDNLMLDSIEADVNKEASSDEMMLDCNDLVEVENDSFEDWNGSCCEGSLSSEREDVSFEDVSNVSNNDTTEIAVPAVENKKHNIGSTLSANSSLKKMSCNEEIHSGTEICTGNDVIERFRSKLIKPGVSTDSSSSIELNSPGKAHGASNFLEFSSEDNSASDSQEFSPKLGTDSLPSSGSVFIVTDDSFEDWQGSCEGSLFSERNDVCFDDMSNNDDNNEISIPAVQNKKHDIESTLSKSSSQKDLSSTEEIHMKTVSPCTFGTEQPTNLLDINGNSCRLRDPESGQTDEVSNSNSPDLINFQGSSTLGTASVPGSELACNVVTHDSFEDIDDLILSSDEDEDILLLSADFTFEEMGENSNEAVQIENSIQVVEKKKGISSPAEVKSVALSPKTTATTCHKGNQATDIHKQESGKTEEVPHPVDFALLTEAVRLTADDLIDSQDYSPVEPQPASLPSSGTITGDSLQSVNIDLSCNENLILEENDSPFEDIEDGTDSVKNFAPNKEISDQTVENKNNDIPAITSSRQRSIFDISFDEGPTSGSNYKINHRLPDKRVTIPTALVSLKYCDISSIVKNYAQEIVSDHLASPSACRVVTSTTGISPKEAGATCPQSPSISSSTGPSVPLQRSEHQAEVSDSDSSSDDDDVIILEESGFIHSQDDFSPKIDQVGPMKVPLQKTKPVTKLSGSRPVITNADVNMWKDLEAEREHERRSAKKKIKHTKSKQKGTTGKDFLKPRSLEDSKSDPKQSTKSKSNNSQSSGSEFKTKGSLKPSLSEFKTKTSSPSPFSVLETKTSVSQSPKFKTKTPISCPELKTKASTSSSEFKIPKSKSLTKVPSHGSRPNEMIKYDGKMLSIRSFLEQEDIIPNVEVGRLLKDENWRRFESMYDKTEKIKKTDRSSNKVQKPDEAEIVDLESQDQELKKLKTDDERRLFSQVQFKNSTATDPSNNLTTHGFRRLAGSTSRYPVLNTSAFSISAGHLKPLSGYKRKNENLDVNEVPMKIEKKIELDDFGIVMKKIFVHKFNKKLGSRKVAGADLEEFQTYLGHYKTGKEETANFLGYYNPREELNLNQVKEVIDLENQYSTFSNYYGEAQDFFCKDCMMRHKFCQ